MSSKSNKPKKIKFDFEPSKKDRIPELEELFLGDGLLTDIDSDDCPKIHKNIKNAIVGEQASPTGRIKKIIDLAKIRDVIDT